MAETSPYKQEARIRYRNLADAYQALCELYREQGKAEQALEYKNKADEARKAVPDS
jgi:hypothetical protein